MINIAIKLATSITYTADGSQTNFSIPFDYLRPSFVHVAVNDAEVSEGFTVSNRGIMFDTAPAKAALVKIYRKTPTSRLVSWADASILKAIDMTIAEVQQLHILEEASDWSKTNSIVLDEEGNTWQGRNCRMSNIADPTEAQDVVTKHYLDNEEGSFTATMNALKTKTEEAASTAETNAKQARFNAEKANSAAVSAERDAATALKSANNAKTSETNVNASKEAAQSAANSASNFATDARSSANEAKSYRDAASTYATNAKNYSENVNVFVPSVSAEGVLSWSNKAGLINPPSVSIKGEKGDRGLQGVQGDMGAAATIKIGTVTTGAAGSNASVTNSGTASNAVFDFVLPKGKDGADGGVTVDDTLSDISTNPVQNKVVKSALDNRAVLDDTNTFTSPNRFDDIYMADGMSSLKWYNGSPNFVVASINSERYTGEANTAKKATQDDAGNVITSTYATKTELNSYVKSVNNTAPDDNGNVNITVSGGVTVDEELSSTSTNPVQNKVIYNALLNKVGTDIYSGFALMGATAPITWRQGSLVVGSLTASNYTGTALRATQDGGGNTITDTYTKKADFDKIIGDLGVAFQEKVDRSDLADVATSGKYTDLLNRPTYVVQSVNNIKPDSDGNVSISVEGGGSDITVDAELSDTSKNPVQNKVVKAALDKRALLDESNVFTNQNLFIYGVTLQTGTAGGNDIKWYSKDMSTLVASLSDTNYTGTAAKATSDSAGNVITATYAKKADVSGVVKSVNGTKPDSNGNVTIAVSGGGVSTSESNTWRAEQIFQKMKFNFESYSAPRISGATDNPASSVAVYNVQGNFTLDMSVLAGLLNNGDATLFTAYITSNGSYALSITNAGTLKYAGSASDLAITANGLLLNILLIKSSSGDVSSVVQATALSRGD